MPSPLLCEIDDLLRPDHPHLQPDNRCLFLREYLAGVGFQGGETNSLILNLKKSPDRRGQPEWRYREKAIARVVAEPWIDRSADIDENCPRAPFRSSV